jgi:16S rRNA C967 or C1407 C5-methylase (RsmB/RsmF family)
VSAFLSDQPEFAVDPLAGPMAPAADGFLRLTPLTAGTDGFFVAALRRG